MKKFIKSDLAIIAFLSLVIIAAFVWLWGSGPTGLPQAEQRELTGARLFFTAWIGSSLLLAPLINRFFKWAFKSHESHKKRSEGEQQQDEKGDS